MVALRVDSGDNLLFVLDTGAPFTLLDNSLEPKLEKPLSSRKIHSPYGDLPGRFHKTPKLYLDDVQLQTGNKVMTVDLSRVADDLNRMTSSNGRVAGVLGMDCLQHYCIQLDFAARKLRFLNPENMGNADLGTAFPMTISRGAAFVSQNLLGIKEVKSEIDTGCNSDGVLTPGLFQQWTNQALSIPGHEVSFPNGIFGGRVYTNLILTGDGPNLLGLRFLARHLVTLNFPKRMAYLKRIGAAMASPLHPAAQGGVHSAR